MPSTQYWSCYRARERKIRVAAWHWKPHLLPERAESEVLNSTCLVSVLNHRCAELTRLQLNCTLTNTLSPPSLHLSTLSLALSLTHTALDFLNRECLVTDNSYNIFLMRHLPGCRAANSLVDSAKQPDSLQPSGGRGHIQRARGGEGPILEISTCQIAIQIIKR